MRFSLPLLLALALGALAGASIPLPVQHYTEQLVDHFRGATLRDQDALRRRIICIVGANHASSASAPPPPAAASAATMSTQPTVILSPTPADTDSLAYPRRRPPS